MLSITWLLIIPLNVIAVVLALSVNNWMESGNLRLTSLVVNGEAVLMVAAFSVPFATPGLFGLMIVVWLAREFIYEPRAQFLLIAVACCFITVGCYLLLEGVLDLNLTVQEYMLLVTASVAAVITVLSVTRKYYYAFIRSLA